MGKQDNSSQAKQKYQFQGSLVPTYLNFMVLYYYIWKATPTVSQKKAKFTFISVLSDEIKAAKVGQNS